nr:MAG TPA: hypothetical protein [Caudoviricetes sp.]
MGFKIYDNAIVMLILPLKKAPDRSEAFLLLFFPIFE